MRQRHKAKDTPLTRSPETLATKSLQQLEAPWLSQEETLYLILRFAWKAERGWMLEQVLWTPLSHYSQKKY